MITIDELFAEDFEPLWMTRSREAALQAFAEKLNLCKVRRARKRWKPRDLADEKYLAEARASEKRIAGKCRGVWYRN